jgi:hypothetical protein
MLKELVQALVEQAGLRKEFRRNPASVLLRFEVSAAEQKLLLEQDEAGLVAALGTELLASFRAIDRRLQVGYPGTPRLEVAQTKYSPGTNAALDIAVTWAHEGLPRFGLPSWVRVDILNEVKLQVESVCVVPNRLDFEAATGAVTVHVNLKPGRYFVVLRVTNPEVQDSEPAAFTV